MAKRKFRKRGKGRKHRKNSMSVYRWPKNENSIYKNRVIGYTTVALVGGGNNGYVADYYNPTYGRNVLGIEGQLPNIPTSHTRLVVLFDEYRVTQLRARLCPANVDTVQTAAAAATDRSIYMVPDYDDNALPASEVTLLNQGHRPISYANGRDVSKVMRIPEPNKYQWRNTSNIGYTSATAQTGGIGLGLNAMASMKCILFNTAADVYLGKLYFEWDVEYRGLRIT